jgi:hypothetical protein
MLPGPEIGKWKFEAISTTSPISPASRISLTCLSWSWNGKTNASHSSVPVSRAAARTRCVSARVPHSGFSHSTGLPASSARIVHSACSALGRGM